MRSVSQSDVVVWTGLAALQLNIGIHAALTPMHLEEKFYIGVLFTIGNAALFVATLMLASTSLRTVGWALGALTSVVEFVGFIVSRTTGLPQGYKESWAGAPEDVVGLVCLVTEVVFVALAIASRRRGRVEDLPSPQFHPMRLDVNRTSVLR